MNKKNGINKVNTNVKSSKFGINQNIKNLSQKNYKKAKINSTTNKIKKTNSPKNLNNQETKIRNPYYPMYPGISERGKTKISQSVNILNDDYNDLNYYYNNDYKTVKPKSKKDSKKTSVFTNNKKNEEKEKLKKNRGLCEEERKKKEKEKEKEKERENQDHQKKKKKKRKKQKKTG